MRKFLLGFAVFYTVFQTVIFATSIANAVYWQSHSEMGGEWTVFKWNYGVGPVGFTFKFSDMKNNKRKWFAICSQSLPECDK